MTTDASPINLSVLRERWHNLCFVCGKDNHNGLGLDFKISPNGGIETAFVPRAQHQGFPGRLHGGVISAALDAAMINLLFSKGIVAVTAELTVRFVAPVALNRQAKIKADITEEWDPDYALQRAKAELIQEDKVVARATGKFFKMKEAHEKR